MARSFGPNIKKEEIIKESLIASGEYGSVYRGKCRGLPVAIKNPIAKLSSRNLIAFRREVEIMSEIYHPNVCLFLGASTESGEISIVTELMSGSLSKLIFNQKEPIPLSTRLGWALQAANGVNWLHTNEPPVIHMDLKPDNILFDNEHRIKVCDFGLSKFKEGAKAIINQPTGTPLYMAPEIMEVRANQPKQVTEKADVYSFAIILWEMLTQEEAYRGFDNYITFSKAVRTGVRPPIPKHCPPRLESLLQVCWAPEAKDRPLFKYIVAELEEIIKECAATEKYSQIQDAQGVAFWDNCFPDSESVVWDDFIRAFFSYYKLDTPANLDPDNIDDTSRPVLCFKAVLDPDQISYVKMANFGKVLGWFGPLEPPSDCELPKLLTRIQDLLSQTYFHGYISSAQAAAFLNNSGHEPSSYLVRFSQNYESSFCLTKIATDGSIRNVIIKKKPDGYQVDDSSMYESLPELINCEAQKRRFLVPVPSETYSWLFNANNKIASSSYGGGYGCDLEED